MRFNDIITDHVNQFGRRAENASKSDTIGLFQIFPFDIFGGSFLLEGPLGGRHEIWRAMEGDEGWERELARKRCRWGGIVEKIFKIEF